MGAVDRRGNWHPSDEEVAHWWGFAGRVARDLAAGAAIPPSSVFGPVLGPHEQVYWQVEAGYSRLYGGSGTYEHSSLVAFGRPAFMVGAYAVNAMANSSRRRAAERNAEVRWREHQPVQVIATTERFLCHTANHGWLSFWFAGVSEFYPELESWTLTLAFVSGEPLQLSGLAAPALAVVAARHVEGPQWVHDPRLQLLFRPSVRQPGN